MSLQIKRKNIQYPLNIIHYAYSIHNNFRKPVFDIRQNISRIASFFKRYFETVPHSLTSKQI